MAVETKLDIVIKQVNDIGHKLDKALPTYVTQSEFQQYKGSQNIQKVLLAVLMSFIGALGGYFIAHIGR